MSKTKGRTSVPVAVEEFDVGSPSIATVEAPIIERPRFKSDLGFWWECLAGLVLLQGFLNVFRSWSKIWEHSDIGLALLIVVISVALAIVTGRYAGKESGGRKLFGFGLIVAGLIFGVASFALGAMPDSSLLTYAAVGLTVTGWALRRLLGESVVRCVSLGLVAALPLLFLDGSRFIGAFVVSVKEFINFTANWFTGVVAELNHVPFAPLDGGIKFASGELHSIAAFDNVAGIFVALALSVACSVVGRQSFLSGLLSAVAAYMWWAVIRSYYCLNMATTNSLDGPLSELAMPILALAGLLLLIVATNLCVASFLAVIPIDPGQFEVSALTQIYNACVSFPQLGPTPATLVSETTTKEAPLTKEDRILDEYKRAKEASLSPPGAKSATLFSETNSDE